MPGMRNVTSVLGSAIRWLTLAAVLATTGCDFAYSVERRAMCAGVSPERLAQAVSDDPTTTTTRPDPSRGGISIGGGDDVLHLYAKRKGITANVHVSRNPDQVSVSITDMSPPRPDEVPIWTERVEYLCGRMSAACPELGPWRSTDDFGGPSATQMATLFALFAIPAAGFVLYLRHRYRAPRPPPTPAIDRPARPDTPPSG